MLALRHDLVIEQGASFRLALRWFASDGTPVDLAGCTAACQVRVSHGATPVLVGFSSDLTATPTARVLLGGSDGTVTLEADPVITRALSFKQGVYDVVVTSADGDVYRLAEGRVILSREVTV